MIEFTAILSTRRNPGAVLRVSRITAPVPATASTVNNFSIYIYVYGCGSYQITRTLPAPIVNGKFNFTGSYYVSGTFGTITSVSGQLGLKYYYIPGCGYVSGGPYSWSATWRSADPLDPATPAQPTRLLRDAEAFFFGGG